MRGKVLSQIKCLKGSNGFWEQKIDFITEGFAGGDPQESVQEQVTRKRFINELGQRFPKEGMQMKQATQSGQI